MQLRFSGEVVEWRGPAPHLFVRFPSAPAAQVDELKDRLTYGWGCIPVRARLGGTTFTTSLFPREGGYLLPLKVAVRRAEQVGLGDVVEVEVDLSPR